MQRPCSHVHCDHMRDGMIRLIELIENDPKLRDTLNALAGEDSHYARVTGFLGLANELTRVWTLLHAQLGRSN